MIDQHTVNYPHRICYVEDSSVVSAPVLFGMEKLLGARVDLFHTTDSALKQLREGGMTQWGTFILDNRTGHGTMSGIVLGQTIKSESPEALVVSMNSSDMQEMVDFGLDKLTEIGIEFWYKVSESFLMLPWLADCAKEGRMISRYEWLTRMGEPTRYLGATEISRPTELALRMICMSGTRGVFDETHTGVLMREDTTSYLRKLVAPGGGPERR